jgi:hypothetical protein
MKKIFSLTLGAMLCLTLFFTAPAMAQSAPNVEWQKSLGGTKSEVFNKVFQTPDGGQLSIGYAFSNDGNVSDNHSNNGSDAWIVKTNSMGDIQWQKCLGGNKNEAFLGGTPLSNGNWAFVGYTSTQNNTDDVKDKHGNDTINDIWVVITDPNANIIVQKCLGGALSEVGNSVIEIDGGDILVAGYTESSDGDVTGHKGGKDAWVVRLTSSLGVVWSKTYGGSDDDYANELFYYAGKCAFAGAFKSADGDITDWGYENAGGFDGIALHFSPTNGNIAALTAWGGSNDDYLTCVALGTDNNLMFAGASNSGDGNIPENKGEADCLNVQLDQEGTSWYFTTTDGGSDIDSVMAICTVNQFFIEAGASRSNDGDVTENKGGYDVRLTEKLLEDGTVVWDKTYGGSGDDYANSIASAGSGSYFVAGATSSTDIDTMTNHGELDGLLIKFSGDFGTNTPAIANEDVFAVNIYPNPTSDLVTISFNGMAPTEFALFKTNGQLITRENVALGTQQMTFDLKNFAAGTYTFRFAGNGKAYIERVVVAK